MRPITRRNFLKTSFTAGLALSVPRLATGAGANDAVQIAIVGLGGIKIPGSVGGRGRQLIGTLRKVAGARIVALCDVDRAVLDDSVQAFKSRGEQVTAFTDIRKLLEDKSVDAVVVATPNHWHALATVWSCQAGKDVYTEKPFSHDLWEGQQMVAAARKHGRVVQVGMQNHSSPLLREAFAYLHSGELGPIRFAHALVYRPREGIDRISSPTQPPATVDYDLWCGPVPMAPLNRPHLHYEWHWFWDTGNGEMGNNGVHVIDQCRWGLRHDELPSSVVSVGGRYAVQDAAETPNTHIALFGYKPAPIICEVRNVRVSGSAQGIGKFRGTDHGIVIDCEGGYLAGEGAGATVFDHSGKKIRAFEGEAKLDLEAIHMANFLGAVRSRKTEDVAADALQGHLSAGCCHMANVSHRVGKTASPEAIAAALQSRTEFLDAFERCREYLKDNGVDLGKTPAVLGASLTLDPKSEQFTGAFAREANQLCRRTYREPFAVPQVSV